MKKILAVCMMAVMCFMVAACGGKDGETTTPQEGENKPVQEQQQEQVAPEQGDVDTQTQNEGEGILDNPVSIVYEFENENLNADSGEVYFYAGYTKPVVTIRDNAVAADKINMYFDNSQEAFEQLIDDYAVDAKDYYGITQGMSNYLWHRDLAQSRADAGIISFIETEDTYLGGAHGSFCITGYNFDTATGEALKLENLSDDPAGFYQMVKKSIIEQCKKYPEQEAFYNPVGSEEFASSIDDVLNSNSWYFTKEGLEIIANQYAIAPYAAGNFTFVIPYDELDGLLDKYAYKGAFIKSVKYEETCMIDLNGDGQEDKIQTLVKRDEYDWISEITFDINDGNCRVSIDNNYTGEDKPFLENPMNTYCVVDLDKSDDYIEIAVGDYGMNDYNATYFYRYTGDKLEYLGYIPDVLENSRVEVYGNGMIKGTMRMEMVETVRSNVYYQLKDERVSLIEQDWYVPDYSHYSEEYLEHDVLQDVTVYKANDVQSEKVILKKGEEDVRFLATDNVEWVKLQTEDGAIYYMHMVQPIIVDSDGTEGYVTDIFEGILLAG